MKTNLWKLSCMALAMAAIVTGCNQNNELGTPAPSGEEDVLNVVATANDFVSSDATSRIIDTNYTTTFEAGDNIGVFVVRDGEALVSNMKMTLGSDNVWAGESGAKLYYYKDADYIAYSPYTEGLSVTSEEEIITHFTTKLEDTTGQATLADYQAADLMTASVTAAEVTRGENITFNFAHQMSMIEIKVPIRAYKTSEGYEYSAPLGLKVTMAEESAAGKEFSLCTFGKETISENESEVTKGIYRCIVAPSGAALKVTGEFLDGSAPVYFPATGGEDLFVAPEAGTYKGFDVNYTYDKYTTATRELKVGDYYYADGSICPGDMKNIPSNGCVGVIFSTTTSAADAGLGWSNGYVMSLFDTDDTNTKYSWSTVNEDIPNLKLYEKSVDSFTSAFADYDGYSATQAILAATSYSPTVYAAVNAAVTYDKEIPSSTSGWYLPSVGQVALIINELGAKKGTKPTSLFTPQNAMDGLSGGSGKFDENRGAPEAMLALQETLQKVGGEFHYYPEQSYGYRWWTSSGVSNDNAKAWAIDTNKSKFLLYDASKSDNGNMHVRPVFAF